MDRRRREGYTLVEIAFLLCIVAVLLSRAIPMASSAADGLAVRLAREEVIRGFQEARLRAYRMGEAELVLTESGSRLVLRSPANRPDGRAVRVWDLAESFGVGLDVQGSADEVVLRFDGLGMGRTMGRSLVLEKRAARANLIVSSYGRVRRE